MSSFSAASGVRRVCGLRAWHIVVLRCLSFIVVVVVEGLRGGMTSWLFIDSCHSSDSAMVVVVS